MGKLLLGIGSVIGVGALLAGCGGGTTNSSDVVGLNDQTGDFIAVATSNSKQDVAVLTGSVVKGKGAGEANAVGSNARPTHFMFTTQGTGASINWAGGDVHLTPNSDGRLTGRGSVNDASGKPVDVEVSGSWLARNDEKIGDLTKCGKLDEKLLVVGDASPVALDAVKNQVTPVTLDMSLQDIAYQWADFDGVMVNAKKPGAVASPQVKTFMQGSKWVIITNPEAAKMEELKQLMPTVPQSIWKDSWAVAARVGDPGGSWNQNYHTVPLPKSTANKDGKPTEDQMKWFVEELHLRGDQCAPDTEPEASTSPSGGAEQSPKAQSGPGQNQAEVKNASGQDRKAQVLVANHEGSVSSQMVAVPAYNDSVTTRADKSMEPPGNLMGFTHSNAKVREFTLPGSLNFDAHPNCKPNLYKTMASEFGAFGIGGNNADFLTVCPKEVEKSQVAQWSYSDKVFAFLSVTTPATMIKKATSDLREGIATAHASPSWVVMHQQSGTFNATKKKDDNNQRKINFLDESNGKAKEKGNFTGIGLGSEDDFPETSWLLTKAQTEVDLGSTKEGTASFVTKPEASYPLTQIRSGHKSESISTSWGVNVSGGTFGNIPMFNLGGSYSVSDSKSFSIDAPQWEVTPNYGADSSGLTWSTATTGDGTVVSPSAYEKGNVHTFGYNKLNVGDLTTNSIYAWESPCMFGSLNMKVKRNAKFGGVFSFMPIYNTDKFSNNSGRFVNDRPDQDKYPVKRDPDKRAGEKGYGHTVSGEHSLMAVDTRSVSKSWKLPEDEYHIDFDDPRIGIYPETIAGFGKTVKVDDKEVPVGPDGKPVQYKLSGCETPGKIYPMPASLEAEFSELSKKQKADAEAKKLKEEAEAKKKADDEAKKSPQPSTKSPSASQTPQSHSSPSGSPSGLSRDDQRKACYAKKTSRETDKCLLDNGFTDELGD